MKIRTAVISVAVSASLVAGVGYGAYYSMKGKVSPVQVVPVANVNSYWGYGGDEDTIYGSITSQVAQTEVADEQYTIDQVFVEEGDTVKEGTPLFSYDMTLPELELEMAQLNLQSVELTKVKLEKELEKLKKNTSGTSAAAAMPEQNESVLTTSSDEVSVDEIVDEPSDSPDASSSGDPDSGTAVSESSDSESSGDSQSGNESGDQDGFVISSEEVAGEESQETDAQDLSDEETRIRSLVSSYEQLASMVSLLMQSYGDSLEAEDLRDAMNNLVPFYRNNLADGQETEAVDFEGDTVDAVTYDLKQEVREVLSDREETELEQTAAEMDQNHAQYVTMLISELDAQNTETISSQIEEAKEEYESLAAEVKDQVSNIRLLSAMEDEILDSGSDQGNPSETDPAGSQTEDSQGTTETDQTSSESDSGQTDQSETVQSETVQSETVQSEVVAEPETTPETAPETETERSREEILSYLESFLSLAETALGADGAALSQYSVTDLGNAIAFYQTNLAQEDAQIVSSGSAKMNAYLLREDVKAVLAGENRGYDESYLASRYQNLCITLVRTMIDNLNPRQLTATTLDEARSAYESLGEEWAAVLDASVSNADTSAPADGTVSNNGSTESSGDGSTGTDGSESETGSESGSSTGSAVLTYGEKLDAYEVILQIQGIDSYLSGPESLLISYLNTVYTAYQALNSTQQSVVWNSETLMTLLAQYGLLEPETEDDGGDDMPGFGDDSSFGDDGYSAEDLKEMIEDTERSIKDTELDIREAELEVKKQQRIVDGKVVKSTMDGTVTAIGSVDGGNTEDGYFVKVVNETGLYATGVMSELSLDRLKVGDSISGQTDDGMMFTAVIKEVSEYPDANGSSYSMSSSQNTNVSYYPFYALIDDPDGIVEGGATIQLSGEMTGDDAIFLSDYFIRTDSSGQSYVYKQGEDGKLTKQIVVTGTTLWDSEIEIVSGLSKYDNIAFPYGDNVQEGAPTEEVETLDDLY